ncbi:MAG: phosphoribosylanthranilate isomerase [Rikenellaceae bacterium]
MLVKVCGMRDQQNAEAVESLGISMMGFIFHEPSPRYVGTTTPTTSQGTTRVGVFVNKPLDYILNMASLNHLDAIQLHGTESVELCKTLKTKGFKVLKAISVATVEDLRKCADYEPHVDLFVFDTKCSGYGGSGERFDWGILDSYQGETPFLLSGGIDKTMSEEIKTLTHHKLIGVDLNSRFEISPALKDANALKYFIENLRGGLISP